MTQPGLKFPSCIVSGKPSDFSEPLLRGKGIRICSGLVGGPPAGQSALRRCQRQADRND